MSDEKMCCCGFELVEYREKYSALHKENEALRAEIAALYPTNFEAVTLKAKYDNLKNKFNYHYEHLQQRIGQAESLLKERDALKAEIESLKKSNEEQSEIYCQRNLVLCEENQKLNREIKSLKEQFSEIEFHNKQYSGILEVVKKEKEQLERAVISLKKTNGDLARELLKPEDETEFKVGDRVCFTPTSYSALSRSDKGTIVSFNKEFTRLHFNLKMDDGSNFTAYPGRLELVEESKELKIGDKVKVSLEGLITSSYPSDNLCPDGYFVVENKQGGESWLVRSKYVTKTEG